MKTSILNFLILTGIIFLSACAASFSPINPPSLNYDSHDSQDGIELSYQYDALRSRGNKKYANKEAKKGVKLIAVKLTNNTDSVINVGRDMVFYSGRNQIFPVAPLVIKESIKQIVPAYLPYMLLTFLNLYITPENEPTETYRVGLALGPGITAINMLVAASANQALLDELSYYNIINQDIEAGETVYGILGVRDMGYSPISVKMLE